MNEEFKHENKNELKKKFNPGAGSERFGTTLELYLALHYLLTLICFYLNLLLFEFALLSICILTFSEIIILN